MKAIPAFWNLDRAGKGGRRVFGLMDGWMDGERGE